MRPEERLIIAIDATGVADILQAVNNLRDYAETFKIGSTAFSALGPNIVKAVKKLDKKVFVDLKLFDIPEQVSGAAGVLTTIGADMITVHALGGVHMMAAAKKASVAAAKKLNRTPPMVLGVTVLTSLDDAWLARLDIPGTDSTVPALACAAQEAGLDGVVAAAREVAEIRNACGGGFKTVVPGIRLKDAAADDQLRVAEPDTALRDGADYLVVGRPITGAKDPQKAAEEMVKVIMEVAL
jgi:orotidine-5'-phosphate decarboxylase